MEQKDQIKIGIIICDRYHRCAGGKCFRALREVRAQQEAQVPPA